jgi:RimJ/RimL family protein N-acetyltransferase
MEPVTLTTDRLLLRPFTPRDAEAVRAAVQDPEIPRWTTVPSPYTAEHAREWVCETSPRGWAEDTQYNFGLFTHDGGHLVGCMGLVRLAGLRTPQRQAELGYWTAAEHRRRGYTAEAAREVCRWAFADLGVERLEWYAEAGNHGSRAVALKAGFRMEGTLRAFIVHNATRRDAWVGSLLPSDHAHPQQTPYLPYER